MKRPQQSTVEARDVDAKKYIEWNQLSRHQLITAHMIMVDELDRHKLRLADALRLPSYASLDEVISTACVRLNPPTT